MEGAKVIGILILIALVIFIGPWVVMTGWNMIAAGMFALPTMTYWPAFFGTWALHIIFERTGGRSTKDS